MTTTEIIFHSDGKLVAREITERPCVIPMESISRLGENTLRVVPRLVDNIPPELKGYFDVPITTGLKGNITYWSIPVRKLHIDSFFAVTDGVLTPNFQDGEGHGRITLDWEPALAGMLLRFGCLTNPTGHLAACNACFLIAYDGDRRAYRIPLPNVYENCSLCMGRYAQNALSHYQAVINSMLQFKNGSWNHDLARHETEHVQRMFRFKPGQGDEPAKQLDTIGPWMQSAQRVSDAIIDDFVALL